MEVTVPNKKRLFIIGAGDFGRELESWLELIPETERNWSIAGYLDKNKNALDGCQTDYQIVGDEDTFSFEFDDLAIVGIADPEVKEKIYHHLKGKVKFFTFIFNNAVVGKFNKIGEGAVICPNCVITTNVSIGKLVTVNCGAQIGHDVQIGDFSSIQSNVDLGGDCNLGKKVYIGLNATVIPGKTVCDSVKISAGSIVINKINKGTVVFGNPAKKI